MNGTHSNEDRAHTDLGSHEVDQVLEGLRPRMRAARIRQVRFIGAIVAIIPILGLSAVAFAQTGGGASVSVASGGDERSEGTDEDTADGVGTDIGDAGDEQPADEPDSEQPEGTEEPDEQKDDEPEAVESEPVEPQNLIHDVEVATFGVVKVRVGDEGVTLVEAIISEPWEFVGAETNEEGDLVVKVTDGESIKLITIGEGLWDELHVKFDDFVPPTTTTTTIKPEPKPEPPPPPPVVDRIVLQVPPAGSFVVEREGEVLWAGNVQPNEGFEYDIIKAEGWKVQVAFFSETTIYHGKAWISEDGRLLTETWSEAKPPPAVTKWAEISCVGAAQFKLQEGLILVTAVEKAAGITASWPESWVESAAVTFVRTETGESWTIEAWPIEGQIQTAWSGPEVVC
jgi:hypothetical protein